MEKNEVYGRQLGILVFIITLAFKLARLPAVLAEHTGVNLLGILLLSAIEVVLLLLVLLFVYRGGFDALGGSFRTAQFALLAVLVLYYFFKGTIYFAYTVQAVRGLMFDEIPQFVLVLTLGIPVFYLAAKGVRTTARTAELFFPFLIAIIAFSLFCLKTDMDFLRNLPLLPAPFASYAKESLSVGFWGMDGAAFLFYSVKKTKGPRVGIAIAVTYVVILAYYVISNAIMGDWLTGVPNVFVSLCSYNFFVRDLGRLDWLGIIAWLSMSVIGMAVIFGAAMDAIGRICSHRSVTCFGSYALVTGVCLIASVPNVINMSQHPAVSFVLICVPFAVVLALLSLQALARKNNSAHLPLEPLGEDELRLSAAGRKEGNV